MRAIAMAILVTLLLTGTAHATCTRHSKYCRAVSARHTLRVYRHQEAVEAHRANVKPPATRPLPWRPVDLRRALVWHHRHLRWMKRLPSYVRILNYSSWMCIHEHESTDWHIIDRGYEGGLQMDSSFSHSYGADMYVKYHGLGPHVWTPHDQLVVAQRAWRVRGFEPWTTAPGCGL